MHIYSAQLKYLWLALPPPPEQAAIAEYLDKATAAIDSAIARARRQIGLLHEYRTRLIADVVTGKLDVREAAADCRTGPTRRTRWTSDGLMPDNMDGGSPDESQRGGEPAMEAR